MKSIVWSVWIPILAAVLFGIAALPFGQLPEVNLANRSAASHSVVPAPTVHLVDIPEISLSSSITSIMRLAQLHTERPTCPRFQVMKCTIQSGDTAWSLAQKFELNIESIFMNYSQASKPLSQMARNRLSDKNPARRLIQ